MGNRLADAPSPYLRQHADNPVEWWEWSDEAFEEAERRDVPVFLSIGYATCHWCHVMAHESFEDDDVAALMNEAFVCIKVDREERPDVDGAYMAACQASGQRCGWPLTAVLDHQRRPWFIGTYIPKHGHGRMGMMELVPRLSEAWATQRSEVEHSAAHLLDHVRRTGDGTDTDAITMELIERAVASSAERFDADHGGFGPAPKFPSPQQLLVLLRHHARSGATDPLAMVTATLDAMAAGGIHDHVGGGFHRYSTDPAWHLPHFEKMLYDQAMLMMAYTEAFQSTRHDRYARVVEDIATYVLRDLRHPDGGFYCAEDADSDGEEGTFYIWSSDEIHGLLGDAAPAFMDAFGCSPDGNFHDEATGRPVAANILHLQAGHLAEDHADSLQTLRAAREERNRPLLDDKVLADWNGLMIAALAKAGAALDRSDLSEAAARAARFIMGHLRTGDGTLCHRWHDGRLDDASFLDDHAFMAWGLLELFQTTQDPAWLDSATDLAGRLLERFRADEGRLRLTARDAPPMIVDATSVYDGAMPSGTSIAVLVLERLGRITADTRWTDAAWDAVRNVDGLSQHPAAFDALLLAVPGLCGEAQEVVVTGDGPVAKEMRHLLQVGYCPDAVILHRGPDAADMPDWVSAHDGSSDAAYVCRQQSCDAPVHDVDALRSALAFD